MNSFSMNVGFGTIYMASNNVSLFSNVRCAVYCVRVLSANMREIEIFKLFDVKTYP